ncbi:MAG: hypothetical protein VB023_08960 [Oscillibacter sp.]|nr:hypothetical protein [Oscillibacter sp.]
MEQVLGFCKDTLEMVTGFFLNLVWEVTEWVTHTVTQLTGRAVMYVGKKCWCRTQKLMQPVFKGVMIVSAATAAVSGVCYLLSRRCDN